MGSLGSLLVMGDGDLPRDLAVLVVPGRGGLEATGDLFQPYRLVDDDGGVVAPVAAYFAELSACGRPGTTQRSYGMDLLRWFRFLWALGVAWDRATGVEARDFCRWLQIADKPVRPHWRRPDGDVGAVARSRTGPSVNAVTGKAMRGSRYAAATVAHCETVLRGFYDFHLEAGTGPMVNPVPGGPILRCRPRGCPSQSDGAVRRASQRPVSAEGGGSGAAVYPG